MTTTGAIHRRDEQFIDRTVTRIWKELPSPSNPYLAAGCLCHGYDLMELAQKRSFVEVLFLLFIGELPTQEQARMLEVMMVACINPGPRHPATRSAMNAGVGKTQAAHILPIGLSVLSGSHLGGNEVINSMKYLFRNNKKDPFIIAQTLIKKPRPSRGDYHPIPGFGSRFGGIDPIPQNLAEVLGKMPASGSCIKWGHQLAQELKPHGMGWLIPGIAAAVLCDLGFSPLSGAGLFQIISAPGLLAHGLELIDKPVTAMPFLDEKHYVISRKAQNG